MESDQLSRDLASLKIDRAAPPPARSKSWIVVVLVLAALGAVGWFVIYPRVHSALTTPEIQIGEIQMVSPAQASVQLTATGYVVALSYANVASKVPGRIAELYVDEGSEIKQGDKVARLEDVDFKSSLAAAKSRAAAAYSKVAIARSQLTEIKVQIDREKPLVESGVDAKAVLVDLQAKYDSLTAAVSAAQADAAAANAEVASLQTQLGSYTIITPISGTVVKKLVQVGEGVSPGFGTPGVVEVVDMSSLVVEVDVPETRLSQVSENPPSPCEIVLDAYSTERFRGEVKEIGHTVNKSKATVPVKVRFISRPKLVLPDMAARVSFLSKALDEKDTAPAKLVVPAAAVVQRGGADVIFVYDEGDVRQTSVKVGEAVGDGKVLETQIPAGTKVILSPPPDLKDGQKVKEKK
ncbi:MAG TPA: efflux RND transporter periplasmic adaptor subunit [Kofleriaceae bacterium]|nr:efflux RND transporter periplasmic adaptor subunit [Kofleriaceae bacterium]